MRPHFLRASACVLLSGGVLLLAAPALRAFDEIDDARADIEKLAQKLQKGKAITPAEVKAFVKKNEEVLPVMTIFKPVVRRGLAFEKVLIDLTGKRLVDKADLGKRQAELVRLSTHTQAVSEVLPGYASSIRDAKTQRLFKQYAEDMKKGATDLRKAVGANDSAAVRKAALDLRSSCTNCHAL